MSFLNLCNDNVNGRDDCVKVVHCGDDPWCIRALMRV